LLGAYIILLVRTAWMCDDAFITLRTVDNFVQGYGLVWNIGERVQAYTHPLWMFLLSAFYAFTREPYFTTLAISMALSLATVVLLLWTGRHHLFTLLLIGIISIGSKAFADYSTLGLENPLAHLLLVAFFVLCLRQPPHPRYAFPLGALAGLIMLNRLDHGVLVIPALLAAAIQLPRRAAVTLLAAAGAPVAGWLLFSLVYYGFPFPNTFYAKQTLGIPRIEYLQRGVSYVADTAVVDGVTLLGITFAVGWAVWRRSVLTLLSAAAGILLYVLYVVWIVGDFMGGRMFSAPLAASLAVLASAKPTNYRYPIAILAILFTTALVLLNRPYLTSPEPLRGAFTGSIEQAFLGKPSRWLIRHR
jgi:arabinofuranosyltransferase